MNRLKKTDYFIIAVLLLLIAFITFMAVNGGKDETGQSGNALTPTAVSETLSEPDYTDYNGKRIGIITGSSFEPITLEKFPDSEYFYFDNPTDLIAALLSGKIDAFAEDEPTIKMICRQQKELGYLKKELVDDKYCFGFQKGTERSQKLQSEFNELLSELKASGELDRICEKWFSEDESVKVYDDSELSGENGEIVVWTNPELQPFAYLSDGKYKGICVELVTLFARKYGYSINLEGSNISSGIAGLTAGKYDILAGTVSATEERKESMDFSDSFYDGGISLAVRVSDLNGAPAAQSAKSGKTLKDYEGKKIGAKDGMLFDEYIKKSIPTAEVVYFNGYADMLTALKSGKIDAFAGDEPVVKYMMLEDNGVDYLSEYLEDYSFGFAFSKNDKGKALCDEFSEYIKKIKSDGTLAEIDSIWFSTDESKKIIPDLGTLSGEKGKLSLATEAANTPFTYIKDNKIVGFEIDIAYRFCKEYGYGLEITDMKFESVIPAVSVGKNDFGCASITITEERRESVNFSESHYDGGAALVVPSSDLETQPAAAPQTVEDRTLGYYADNGKIGAITGGLYEIMIRERYPQAEILQYNSQPDLAIALSEGKIDAFTCPKSAAEDFMAADSSLTYLNEIFMEIPYGFAFKKMDGENKLRDQMNEYLAKIHANGTYDEIVDTWFGTDESKKTVDFTGLDSGSTTLRYITASTMQPYSYIKDGQNAGLEVDLVARFCKEYGYGLRIDNADFAGLIPGIAGGTYDIASGNIMITEERAQSVDFSDVYYTGQAVSVVRKENLSSEQTAAAPQTVEDRTLGYYADNGKIGAITGGLYEIMIRERYPQAEILQYNSQPDLAIALSEGKIDAFTCPKSAAEDFMAADSSLTYLNEIFMEIPYGFAFKKMDGENKLRDQMNEYLAKIQADGTYDEIVDTWFGTDESKKTVDFTGLDTAETTLRYITASTMQPYSYIKDGQNAGLEIDLVARFCKEYGYGLKIDSADFAGLIPGIAGGTYDIASGNIMITEERAQSVDFSDVYYTGAAVSVVRKEALPAVQPQEETPGEAPEKIGFIDGLKESFNKNFVRENRYKLILEGIGTTCIITALSVLCGSILAFLICMFRRADSVLSGKICDLYVKLLQGTPMVVFLMILYYVIFGKSGMAAMWVAVIGFSLNFGAYVSEILRSGIESIDGGQREAALALGFSENQAFFRFIFPQAAVRQLPVYRGEMISLLKNTSIVGYIAIQDLTKMSDIIRSRTYEAFFPLIATAIIYFIIAWVISLIVKFVLKKIDPRTKKRGVKGVTVK